MTQHILGGCLCGAVRYRLTERPYNSGLCHCETCRRTGSAPALPWAGIACAAFAITQGAPVAYRSSARVVRSFCGTCGSPLTYFHADKPDKIDVMTCSLDDAEAFPPTEHVWVSEKLAWDVLGDGLPAYATGERET
ncbi:GFA family protein [Acidisoma cellulosilytica]|uniref:GFA family protein n=1 Tax=Acidisoma cellulosilyticum TaxID=2802395 RepID=A0A963Z7Q4_9PROT|nr:GFA family protein [Acidisoma cellulosilyticum]MCB8883407.1 GFA family protein [Acidisoma cellulosilyticum]